MKNNSCPNKQTAEWKKLVAHFGEGMAMAAFYENDNVIPTIEQAEKLMSNFRMKEKDEQLSTSSNRFKLSRAATQRELYDCDCHPQYAASRPLFGLYRHDDAH